jgi:outer membrane receptor protein involved in Fe transport
MRPAASDRMPEVVVFSEKPLFQSAEGNLTYNVSESPLAAGSNAGELLNNVPLVTKGADGRITVRGKEPRILIDDKPIELNLQQLQDLLESMPGSSIEKIEVLTNPPPQYAMEQGGVINIVTKKGKPGRSGRLNLSAGTRGEASLNGNFTYRRQGLSLTVNAGAGWSRLSGTGYSVRNNLYADSSNFFNTDSRFVNEGLRPNFRLNLDHDLTKSHQVSLTLQYNANDFDNRNTTAFRNIDRNGTLWRFSRREIGSTGINHTPLLNATYTWKGRPGETLKFFAGITGTFNDNDRRFFQAFLQPDGTPNGSDSTQRQMNGNRGGSYTGRLNYDRMLANKKTFLSMGWSYQRNDNEVTADATYWKKPEGQFRPLDQLSNHFRFHQTVLAGRLSVKQRVGEFLSVTAGVSAEQTNVSFELLKENRTTWNRYWNALPFFNMNRSWKEKWNLTLSYRRTIRRPGIGELNPTIDFSDPYNIRFGNDRLEASTAHTFDLVAGRTRSLYFFNIGVGYNSVEDIFSQVRTLLPEGKTQVTWENISGRKEYEVSTWNGLTLSKKFRLNASASYTYNRYSAFDRMIRKFRDGGSFTSHISSQYNPTDRSTFTASVHFNRIANPQGFSRWNLSMNLGVQQKFLDKRLTVTFNAIDPLVQQQNRVFTYGPGFNLENFSETSTRNFRVSLAYAFLPRAKKIPTVK